jgi:hypothetical protein
MLKANPKGWLSLFYADALKARFQKRTRKTKNQSAALDLAFSKYLTMLGGM